MVGNGDVAIVEDADVVDVSSESFGRRVEEVEVDEAMNVEVGRKSMPIPMLMLTLAPKRSSDEAASGRLPIGALSGDANMMRECA